MRDRLSELLLKRDEGELDAAEQRELVTSLKESREGRRRLIEHQLLSGEIAERLSGKAASFATRRRRSPLVVGAALTSMAALAAAAWLILRPPATDPLLEQTLVVEERTARRAVEVPRFTATPALEAREETLPPPRPLKLNSPLPRGRGLGPELAKIPRNHLVRLRAWQPDGAGMFLVNQQAWSCAGHQRYGLDTLMVGSALASREYVALGWKVIEATFARQRPEGHFGDPPICVAVWLGPLGAALDTLETGPFAKEYAPKIAALRPALRKAAAWLATPQSLLALRRENKQVPSPSLTGAAALASLAARLEQPELLSAALDLAERDVAKLRADGAFEQAGQHDSAFHIHRLVHLHWLISALPPTQAAPFQDAAQRAGEWLRGRLGPDGQLDVSGNLHSTACEPPSQGAACPHGSFRDLRWAVALHAARFDASAFGDLDLIWAAEVRQAQRAKME